AVEVALKMCMQFWSNQNKPRTKVLAFHNAYHGDTFGAMAVSARSAFTASFDPYLFEVEFIDLPNAENIEALKSQLSTISHQLSAFIFEPLVQGSAGMLMYEARYLDELMAHCRQEGILLIADEVMTGFGRTGKYFACDHLLQKPDLMCFSKGLTGGTMPLGITTCTNQIFEAFLSEDRTKTLFHGHSFTANPVACSAALSSLELFLQPETMENIDRICHRHQIFADKNSIHPKLKSVRQTGTILAMEWNVETGTSYFSNLRDQLYQFFLAKNIILRPLGNIIYFLTPYCITDAQLDQLYAAVEDALETF
ncbi:MAG: aminotransferase class III-fold pyridoxal phosphate-dependent enzyme, partial [Janthinobacterium lividum]